MIGDLVLAFVAGLLSCASTCVLPLLPGFVSYMGRRAVPTTGESAGRQQVRVLGNALLFVAGFSTAFVALGAAAGLIGADLRAYRAILLPVAGIALILMGLALLAGMPWLMRERRFDIAHRLPRTPWASYVVGLAFAVGWTPCVGPILAAILIRAGATATAGQGAILLAAYSVGLGVPFLAAAGLLGPLARLLSRMRPAYHAINAVAAVFLIGMGVLIFSDRLTLLNSYFPYISPPFQERLLGPGSQPVNAAPAKGPVPVGQPPPAFTLADTQGHRVSLADLKGKPVLISFWATWCTPCREELPRITAAYRAHRAEDLRVIAVNFSQEAPATVQKFWDDFHLEPAPFLDPDGRVSAAYGVGLRTTGLPVSVFVARDGKVSAYVLFAMDQESLAAWLKDIL